MKLASQFAVVLAVTVGLTACGGDSANPGDDVPQVATLAIATAPELPAGRTLVCPIDGNSTTSGPTCPVIIWNDITFWPLNYEDGHPAVQVVGFDADKEVVKTLAEKIGAKNIWQITVNESQETVILRGQSDNTVTINWSELLPPG